MSKKSADILKPGMGVDLVFNLTSISPVVKSSIIFDCVDNKMIVAQPRIKITPDYNYDTMHVSSLISEALSEKKRKGYTCRILKEIKDYKLANGSATPALELEFTEPLLDLNIRAAFRFTPNTAYSVMGKLIYKGKEFYSGTHFKVFNISISGMGILIPKKINKIWNPLLNIKKNSPAKAGLLFKSSDETESISTMECDVLIVRANPDYNEMSGFVGMSFENLHYEDENTLNKFIHNGQLFEIRADNRL